MLWLTLGSRTAKEQNRTGLYCAMLRVSQDTQSEALLYSVSLIFLVMTNLLFISRRNLRSGGGQVLHWRGRTYLAARR